MFWSVNASTYYVFYPESWSLFSQRDAGSFLPCNQYRYIESISGHGPSSSYTHITISCNGSLNVLSRRFFMDSSPWQGERSGAFYPINYVAPCYSLPEGRSVWPNAKHLLTYDLSHIDLWDMTLSHTLYHCTAVRFPKSFMRTQSP